MKNNIFIMTKAMFKNDETLSSFSTSNRNSKKKSFFKSKYGTILLILFLTLSLGSSFGVIVSELYNSLSVMGLQSLILRLIVPAAGIMVFMFGIFYVMNVFYFSKDVDNYLYLPVKAGEILTSKFLVSLVYEYFIMIIIFAPLLVIYGVKDSAGILYYVYSILILLFIPVLPLVAASIISMVIMRFSKKFKNRDRFNMIAGVLSLFLALGLNFGLQYVTRILSEGQAIIQDINQLPALKVTAYVFPTNHFAIETLISYHNLKGLLSLVILIVIALASILLFYYIGNALYFKGVMGVTESKADRKVLTSAQMLKETSSKNVLFAYSLKELKLVLRTPVYFMNCVLISLIYPLFFLIPFAMGSSEDAREMDAALQFIHDVDPGVLVMVMVGVGFFMGSINIISSTAISREGKNFFFVKYIPVNYMTQIYAKILSSFYIEIVGMVILYLILIFILKLSPMILALSFILVLMASLAINQIGIFFDILWPKLTWDMEQKAVKQNLNSMIHMFLGFALTGLCIFLGVKFNPTLFTAFMISFVLLGVIILLMHFILKDRVSKKFETL
ncbi:MAG: hypothetical protein WBI17_08375 [Clostridiaceae bacterium]